MNARPDLDVTMNTEARSTSSDVGRDGGGSIWLTGRNEVTGDPVTMSLIQSFAILFEVIESLFEFIMLALFVL